jgi:hypothetical protein
MVGGYSAVLFNVASPVETVSKCGLEAPDEES